MHSEYKRNTTIKYMIVILLLAVVRVVLCQTIAEKYADVTATMKPEVDSMDNCSLVLEDHALRDNIREYIVQHVSLVKINTRVKSADELVLTYEPYEQFLLNDVLGTFLLALDKYLQFLSVYTIGPEVGNITIDIHTDPQQCLEKARKDDINKSIKTFILKNLTTHELFPADFAILCNKFIDMDESDIGTIKYNCCNFNNHGAFICNELDESAWLNIFFKMVLLIKIAFIIYSPILICGMCKSAKEARDFVYRPANRLTLNVAVEDTSDAIDGKNFVMVKQTGSSQFSKLKKELCHLKQNAHHKLRIREIYLRLGANEVISYGASPVNFKGLVQQTIIQCNLRRDSPTRVCCNDNMFKMSPCCDVPWYRFLRAVVQMFLAMSLTMPWVVRMWFYFTHEEEAVAREDRLYVRQGTERENVRVAQGLEPPLHSLVQYLTPHHWMFIIMYCVILLTAFVCLVLPRPIGNKLFFITQMSFYKTRQTNKMDHCVKFLSNVIWPFKEFGIVGILVCPLWLFALPFESIILVYQIFPIFNLIVRLLTNLIYYTIKSFNLDNLLYKGSKPKLIKWVKSKAQSIIITGAHDSCGSNFINMIGLLISIITTISLLVLLTESIMFYLECAIYVLFKLLLNPEDLLKYLIITVFVAGYGFNCIRVVKSRYTYIGNVINNNIRERARNTETDVESVTNTAYKVMAYTAEVDNERVCLSVSKDNSLQWGTDGLLFFVDGECTPCISTDFFLQIATQDNFFCPGPAYVAIFRALKEFVFMCVFLLVIAVAIVAMERTNYASTLGLTVVLLIGGCIPLVVHMCVNTSYVIPFKYRDNFIWKRIMTDAINNHISNYTVEDFKVDTHSETDDAYITSDDEKENNESVLTCNHTGYLTLEDQISDYNNGRLNQLYTNTAKEDYKCPPKSSAKENVDMIVVRLPKADETLTQGEVDIYVRKIEWEGSITRGSNHYKRHCGMTNV